MGCDIHILLEKKDSSVPTSVKKADKGSGHTEYWWNHSDKNIWTSIMPTNWNSIQAAGFSRNYGLFALLFDTRNDWDLDSAFWQRGLPKAVSTKTKKYMWPDEHSITYFSITELIVWWDANKSKEHTFGDGTVLSFEAWIWETVEKFILHCIWLIQVMESPYYLFEGKEEAERILKKIRDEKDAWWMKHYSESYRVVVCFDN